MALSLTAEQKELLKIFKIEEQYIVPAYQRPYSWEYDQCFQLYNDLVEAFESNQEYFIGNIIIAKSDSNKDELEIIDGQQRLITLLIIFKVLYILQPELKILDQIIEQKDWEDIESKLRIKSEIFEAKDGLYLHNVLKYSKDNFFQRLEQCTDKNNKINERKSNNKFELNALYFLSWLKYYSNKKGDLKGFTSFLLKDVYLLPIELTGKNRDEANSKALMIFETINNRGMNLEDADIFKAKLYQRAKKVNEEKMFIDSWIDLKNSCDKLDISIDDLFRYYSHIIRGNEGITSSEINLREFFIREKYSPLEKKTYKEILEDLFKILEILEFIQQEKARESKITRWLQLIDIYTNQYPKYAIITYLYVNELTIDEKLINFLISLVRYVYYQGSTTTVKFEIYNIIKQICLGQTISSYYKDIEITFFEDLGRLKFGFSLLAFYLGSDTTLSTYNIDRLITYRDIKKLPPDWETVNLDSIFDQLGNLIVIDMPKRYLSFSDKKIFYTDTNIKEVKDIFTYTFTFKAFKSRDLMLKTKLVNFFKGEYNG